MIPPEHEQGQTEVVDVSKPEKPPFDVRDMGTASDEPEIRAVVGHWKFKEIVRHLNDRYTLASVRAAELGLESLAREYADKVFQIEFEESKRILDSSYPREEQAENEKLIKELVGIRAELERLNSNLAAIVLVVIKLIPDSPTERDEKTD